MTREEYWKRLLVAIIEDEPRDAPFPITHVLTAARHRGLSAEPDKVREAVQRFIIKGWVKSETTTQETDDKIKVRLTPEGRVQYQLIRAR
jgi:hypothetical protein